MPAGISAVIVALVLPVCSAYLAKFKADMPLNALQNLSGALQLLFYACMVSMRQCCLWQVAPKAQRISGYTLPVFSSLFYCRTQNHFSPRCTPACGVSQLFVDC
jgi:hypothetical protein